MEKSDADYLKRYHKYTSVPFTPDLVVKLVALEKAKQKLIDELEQGKQFLEASSATSDQYRHAMEWTVKQGDLKYKAHHGGTNGASMDMAARIHGLSTLASRTEVILQLAKDAPPDISKRTAPIGEACENLKLQIEATLNKCLEEVGKRRHQPIMSQNKRPAAKRPRLDSKENKRPAAKRPRLDSKENKRPAAKRPRLEPRDPMKVTHPTAARPRVPPASKWVESILRPTTRSIGRQ